MPISDWQAPETIEHISRLDRAGFAAEFLRRNRSYRRGYTITHRRIARSSGDHDEAATMFAHRWGLRCCL